MPTAKEFSNEVEALALTITGYQNGKSGQNGLCDCIGLVMGAMARLGRGSYPMHSTNYFTRYQMNGLRTIGGEDLQVGQLVYKARSDTSQLNARYQPGGRYYTGDMLDYYHVGVVTGISPLEITHCTSYNAISGIVRDSSTKGWTHVGELMSVDYGTNFAQDNHVLTNEEATLMSKTAYVSVPAGTSTANLRSRPNKKSDRIARVAVGTVVDVLEEADGWAQIKTPDGNIGYMMVEFLKPFGSDEEEPAQNETQEAEQTVETVLDEVTITLPRAAVSALFKALSEVAF